MNRLFLPAALLLFLVTDSVTRAGQVDDVEGAAAAPCIDGTPASAGQTACAAVEPAAGNAEIGNLPGDLGLQHMPDLPEGETAEAGKDPEPEAVPAEPHRGKVQVGAVLAVPMRLLGEEIVGGESRALKWTAGQSFAGRSLDVPVLVARGLKRGPTLCLTGAIHGDELNGVEIIRRTMAGLEPEQMSGTVIGVPVVNLLGFMRGTRYLPDRRDLNRYFPGNPRGSAASRIAYLFFERIIRHCNYLVDIHTGSLERTNLPQLRADLSDPGVYRFTQFFGATAVLHHPGAAGTLRRVASDAGIPAVTFELGEPHTLQPEHLEFGARALETLMDKLGMIDRFRLWLEPRPVFYASRWVRVDHGGILITAVQLGARVREGDVLGTVTNPLSSESWQVRAPYSGRILGMALNQFVLPGFAAIHIGIETSQPKELALAVDEDVEDDTEQAPEQGETPAEETREADDEASEMPDYD